MIVMVLVVASLFFIAPLSGTMMRRRQVRGAAGVRTHGAQRHQALNTLRFTNRARYLGIHRPLEMFKSMIALEALVFEYWHRLTRPPLKSIPNQSDGGQSFLDLERCCLVITVSQ